MEKGTPTTMVPEMTIERAAQVLRGYNRWRLEDHEPCDPPFTAGEIGEAIDVAVDLLENNIIKADMESIIRAVSRETGVTEEEMCGKGRHRERADARAIVAWLAYNYTSTTKSSIGERMNRDHATVIHYQAAVDSWLEEPKRNIKGARITKKLINELENECKS